MSKILVVDDEIQIRKMLTKMLQKRGHEVEAVPNGEQAIETLQKNVPDLIIADIFMPGTDGLETIAQMKSLHPSVKIIAISGGALGGKLDFLPVADSLGAEILLKKPFSKESILESVKKLLPSK